MKPRNRLLHIIMFVIYVFIFISCGKSNASKQNINIDFNALDFDFMQQTIYDVISISYQFKGTPFIAYQLLGTDSDSNYNRYYLQAMIDDISPKLEVYTSVIYPIALTFNIDNSELIRYFYPAPDEPYNYEELVNNFPNDILAEYLGMPQEQYIELIEKFSSTNIWNATSYYGYEE